MRVGTENAKQAAAPASRFGRFGFVAVLVVIAVLSATVLSGILSSASTYRSAYEKLDEKRNNVMALTGAAVGASYLISLTPDDTGTPIANQLTEIGKDFSFIIAAIVLEKYLLTLMGFAFASIIVPVCCVLLAVYTLMNAGNPYRQALLSGAVRLFALGLILYASVPAGVFVAGKIDETRQESIDATIAQSAQANVAQQDTKTEKTDNSTASKQDEASNPLEFLQQVGGDITSAAGSAVESATSAVTGAFDWAINLVSDLIENFGVMIVTSIVIPILVPLVMYLAFKTLFGEQLNLLQSHDQLKKPGPLLPRGNEGEENQGPSVI